MMEMLQNTNVYLARKILNFKHMSAERGLALKEETKVMICWRREKIIDTMLFFMIAQIIGYLLTSIIISIKNTPHMVV